MGSDGGWPRVLHVVTDTDLRGAQVAARSLHEALLNRGWESRIVALSEGRTGGLGVEALGPTPLRPTTLRHLRELAKDADVVVAHGSTTLPASALALTASTPFVYVNIGDPRAWLTTRARLLRTRTALGRAAAVAAISPTAAALLAEWVGVPEGRIRVLPNFRDPNCFQVLHPNQVRSFRVDLGLDTDRPFVVWMGSFTSEKRPDLALDVAESLPEVTLVMAGDGPLARSLRSRAQRIGARLLGPVPQPERLLGAADVVLLTSDTEGVPGVLIEAGMCGVPVVSTDVGFIRDAVLDGRTGRLAGAGDVAALAAGVDEAMAYGSGWGAEGRMHCVASFSEAQVVPRWEQLIRDVLAGW